LKKQNKNSPAVLLTALSIQAVIQTQSRPGYPRIMLFPLSGCCYKKRFSYPASNVSPQPHEHSAAFDVLADASPSSLKPPEGFLSAPDT